jgi:SNF2 family DNA or RNA helicase
MLINWEPDIVVIDEGHRIKNPHSQRAKLCHRLGLVCEYAIDLTGTPKGNKRILDLWSQFQFLVPGLLDSTFGDYKNRYGIRSGFGGFKIIKFRNVKGLSKILAPYIMRIKSEGLPEQVDIPYRVDLTPKAKAIYSQMAIQMLAELEEEKVVTAPIALAKMIKLRQIAGGFIRTNEGEDIEVHRCKLDALQEICEDLKESGVERVVIFAAFHWEIKRIREVLANDWATYTLTGKSKAMERKLAVSMYNSNGGALIAQCSTGAETLNLQAGNYCIDYSTDYSYTNYVQRRKRIHRIGQTKTCFYYQLRAKGTLDASLYRAFGEHQEASDQFVKLLKEVREQI